MRAEDIVAIILALGVMAMLLSGTNIRCFWLDCSQAQPLFNESDSSQFWTQTTNILLGALAGYIAGNRRKND